MLNLYPLLQNQVLHRENKLLYQWRSVLRKHFWRKKNDSKQFSSSSMVGSDFGINNRPFQIDANETAMEEIGLELKQQESDGR